MNKSFIILFFISLSFNLSADSRYYFLEALLYIDQMLSDEIETDFAKAVFATENAYYEGNLNEKYFLDNIRNYALICNGIIESGNIIYPEKDVRKALAQCAVFIFMMDSVPIQTKNGIIYHQPFEYNFEDFAGQDNWVNMFVSTLMDTKKRQLSFTTFTL